MFLDKRFKGQFDGLVLAWFSGPSSTVVGMVAEGMSDAEILQALPARFIEALFGGAFRTQGWSRLGMELAERIAAGGYPAALARASSGLRGEGRHTAP